MSEKSRCTCDHNPGNEEHQLPAHKVRDDPSCPVCHPEAARDTEQLESEPLKKVELTDDDREAVVALVGVAQLEVPHEKVVQVIMESTEILLRRRLREASFPEAVRIEMPEKGEPERELVIGLHGEEEEQHALINRVIGALSPDDPDLERVEVAAAITEAALKLTLEHALPPAESYRLIRLAIDYATFPRITVDAGADWLLEQGWSEQARAFRLGMQLPPFPGGEKG